MKSNTNVSLMMDKMSIPFLEGTRGYALLRRTIEDQGILDRDYGYYAILTVGITTGMLGSLFMVWYSVTILPLIFFSILTGFFMVQFGGLMHDAGHRAVFSRSRYNDLFGLYAAIFTNLSFKNWREVHNKHHAHTNEEGEDPDIDIVFHSFTEEQLKTKPPVIRFLTRYQKFLFYPLRSLLFLTTRIDSILYFRRTIKNGDSLHLVIFLAGLCFWFVLPFFLFPIWKAVTFILIENIVVGFYASNVFAPNHKGMPLVPKGMKLSFLEQQIVTSRNVKPNPITDFLYFGLNYQIEHHLFPNCPRNKLHLITPYVKAICRQYHLEFTVDTVWDTHKAIIERLSVVGELAKEE